MSQITNIIEAIKKQNQNETKGQLSRLEIIFMEILQVLKTNLEDAKKRAALERTFQEEKDYEDERRHKEFIDVLKQFVSMQPPIVLENETKKEEGGGFLDFLKTFLKGLVLKFTTLLGKILKVLGKLAKFSFLLLKKITGILLKTVKIIGKLTLKLGKLLGGAIKKLFQLIRHPNVMKFLSGLRAGIPLALLLGGIYAGREALSEIARRMPDYSQINYKEAYNVLEFGNQDQIRHFVDKLNTTVENDTTGFFESGDEIRAFREATPKGKLQLFVLRGKQIRRDQLREKKKNEENISPQDLVYLKKINPDFYLTDKERKELDELENEPFLPKVSVERTNTSGTPGLQEALDKNKLRVGLTDDPFALLETTQEKPVLPYFESSTTVANETKNLKQLMDEKNDLTKQLKDTKSARDRHVIQQKIKEIDKRIAEAQHKIRQEDTTKPVEPVTRSLRTVEEPDKPKPISRTYAPVNEGTTSVPTTTMRVGDMTPPEQDSNKLNSPVSQTVTKVSDENYTMPPPPSEISSSTSAIKVEPRVETPEEQLQKFINENKALHLRNDLKSMSLEYEELGRILKGTSSQPIKPEVSPSPISQMLNNATIANNDLVLRNMFTLEDQVINNVSNTGRTEVLPDTPMAVEASQRDDTYTLTTVLNRYKRSYV